MSYTPPFIPRADAAFRNWAQSVCTNLHAMPGAYGLMPAESGYLLQRFNDFDAAYQRAVDPETRTRGTIIAKDDARSILRTLIRQYAANIRCNDGITDGNKINVGVRPRNIAHKDRTCPTTQPLLDFIGSLPGLDQLVYHDSNTPNSKAKPYGAERLELWRAFAKPGEPPPKVSEASFLGSFKKSKMLVNQDRDCDSRMEGDGKPTYWARWAGFDGSVGPWSLPLRLASVKKNPVAVAGDRSSETEMRKAA